MFTDVGREKGEVRDLASQWRVKRWEGLKLGKMMVWMHGGVMWVQTTHLVKMNPLAPVMHSCTPPPPFFG